MISFQGKIIRTEHKGLPVSFFVENDEDTIQRHHVRGTFYEQEELGIIERFFKPGDVYLDVGANIGNHAIFVGKYLWPSQMILVEPNPLAVRILEVNIDLNRLGRIVDPSLIGLGLSDRNTKAVAQVPNANLGGTRLHQTKDGTISLIRGDDTLGGRRVDFIKMDVEGMELAALTGMRKLICDNRPIMFIEVEDRHADKFKEFAQCIGYQTQTSFRRYKTNENYLVVPAERYNPA